MRWSIWIAVSDFVASGRRADEVADTLARVAELYFRWRVWVIALGLLGCVLALWVQKPLSRAWAWRLLMVVLVWTLIPFVIALLTKFGLGVTR